MKIDDPIAYMNAVDPALIDWWLAYEAILHEERESGGKKMMSPDQAHEQLRLTNG